MLTVTLPIATIFSDYLTPVQMIEGLAAILGVWGVWYATKGKLWGYPIGGLSVALYCWVCFSADLYAHTGVNAYYFILNLYGWYTWRRAAARSQNTFIVGYCTRIEYGYLFLGLGAACVGLYVLFVQYSTDGWAVFWEASSTAFWAVSMILLAHRRIENWIGWIIGDLIAVPLYFSLGLYSTAIQFIVFLGLATFGYIRWRRLYARQGC